MYISQTDICNCGHALDFIIDNHDTPHSPPEVQSILNPVPGHCGCYNPDHCPECDCPSPAPFSGARPPHISGRHCLRHEHDVDGDAAEWFNSGNLSLEDLPREPSPSHALRCTAYCSSLPDSFDESASPDRTTVSYHSPDSGDGLPPIQYVTPHPSSPVTTHSGKGTPLFHSTPPWLSTRFTDATAGNCKAKGKGRAQSIDMDRASSRVPSPRTRSMCGTECEHGAHWNRLCDHFPGPAFTLTRSPPPVSPHDAGQAKREPL